MKLSRRPHPVSLRAKAAAGGLLIAASGLLTWVRVPPGTSLSGFDTADTVIGLGGRLEAVPPKWIGIAWYGLALACSALVVVAGLAPARALRVVVAAVSGACAVGLAASTLTLQQSGMLQVQGPLVALIGLAVLASGVFAPAASRRIA